MKKRSIIKTAAMIAVIGAMLISSACSQIITDILSEAGININGSEEILTNEPDGDETGGESAGTVGEEQKADPDDNSLTSGEPEPKEPDTGNPPDGSLPENNPDDSLFPYMPFPFEFTATDIYGNNVNEITLGDRRLYLIYLWATW